MTPTYLSGCSVSNVIISLQRVLLYLVLLVDLFVDIFILIRICCGAVGILYALQLMMSATHFIYIISY